MAESPYWNPRHETMPREDLEALQVRKLRNLVEWADAAVPWQSKRLRDARVTADSIQSLDDLRRLPFLPREEWMQGQVEHPPYGPILAAEPARAIRYHMTSGTTGKTPIRVLDSMKDWEWIAEMWCYGLWGFGVRPADVAFIAFGYSTIMVFECDRQRGGMHIIEDHYIEEVVDPATDEPVPYGEMGERVVTSFGRGFIPVLRYRTRDFVVKVPHDRCPCGRTFDIYDGGLRGRVDDMKLVRGTNVYPRAVVVIVRGPPEIDEFQTRLFTEEGIRDEIEVLVEIPDPSVDGGSILEALGKELAGAHEGLRFGVRQAETGSLPRFELKAKRVVDERTVIGTEGERRQP